MIKLSIVIPVLNSHEVVRRQLLHFENIGLPGDTELILVDDGSDPPIENSFTAIAKIYRTHDKRPWTWALARNEGARIAQGDYLLMYDLDHIADRKLIDFVRGFDGKKVQFTREFGVLTERGVLTQDRDILEQHGVPKDQSLKIGPLPNNFAMRRDLFWELGGYREDLFMKPYPQGEDRAWRSTWRTYEKQHGGEGSCVSVHRPVMYMFPNGKYVGDVDADPQKLFHNLSRKTSRNWFHQNPGKSARHRNK